MRIHLALWVCLKKKVILIFGPEVRLFCCLKIQRWCRCSATRSPEQFFFLKVCYFFCLLIILLSPRFFKKKRRGYCDRHYAHVHIRSLTLVSNHYLENCRRSCGDTNYTIKCDGRTHGQKHGRMYVWRRVKLYALLHFVAGANIFTNVIYWCLNLPYRELKL